MNFFTAFPELKNFIPVSLYVHVPWCIRKCPYCDFWSIPIDASSRKNDQKSYINALIDDITRSKIDESPSTPFVSVFFGGGTPSLLSPELIETFLLELDNRKLLTSQTEITLEANPGTLSFSLCHLLKQAGINRLSLGAQTFSSQGLQTLGRIHSAKQTHEALSAIAAHFSRFSIDLMYAYPNQTLNSLKEDLAHISQWKIPHVSIYQLTIEPNTPFGQMPPLLPDDDAINQMEQTLISWAQEEGYRHYETSAFAKDGFECKHNLNYWIFGDYLGIGPGAHSKLTKASNRIPHIWREYRSADIQKYLSADTRIEETHFLTEEDRLFECIMNAGRLREGFNIHEIAFNAQIPVKKLTDAINIGVQNNFFTLSATSDTAIAKPTEKGNQYLNQFLTMILPENNC